MNLNQIAVAWKNNTPAKNQTKSYWTDGQFLYSYKLCIGYTDLENKKVLFNYTAKGNNFVSASTSRHVNLATFYADSLLVPNIANQIAVEFFTSK